MKINKLIKNSLKGKKKLPKMPRLVPPLEKERNYERWLVQFIEKAAGLIRQRIITQLPRWAKNYEMNRPSNVRNDSDVSDEILAAMEDVKVALAREFTETEIRRFAQMQGLSIAEYNEKILKQGLKRVLGFDVFFAEPYIKSELTMFASLNTQLIVQMRDEMLNRVQKDVMLGFTQGVRHEEIAKGLEDYIDPLDGTIRSRARLIARDQVNKLNGQLTELRQNELGITRYIWRTMGDERVRDSHRSKDGKVFEWSDPPPDTGNPGEDIQCRCYAEPILSDLLTTADQPDEN
ncbi:phage head morphogenesis protein [Immundisolibacter sp.]